MPEIFFEELKTHPSFGHFFFVCLFVFLSFLFYFIFKLYIIVLVLPNIKMNPPQVYMCSPSWTLLPPPSPYPPSGSSQCTSSKHPERKKAKGIILRQFYKDISAVRQANEGCYFLFCVREVSLYLRGRQNNWTEPLQESCRHRGVGAVNAPCHPQNCTDVNRVAAEARHGGHCVLCSPSMLAVLNSCLLIANQSSHNRNLGCNVQ